MKRINKVAKEFGRKERVLNWACQNWQLSRPSRVGAVMSLIRECQPKNFNEWIAYYFKHAYTDTKTKEKITDETLVELGETLFKKITEIMLPEWTESFHSITLDDCIAYIHEVTLNRTYDGYITEINVIENKLAKLFPEVVFEETDSELDHAGDIDYIGRVGDKAFGLQIKPITFQGNFGAKNPSERILNNFNKFKTMYGGNVFIILSSKKNDKKEIVNTEVIDQIKQEIIRLKSR